MGQDFVKTFGKRIQKLRKEKGISQEKFSILVGLDRTYISGIETGKRNPSLFVLKNIADALGTSLEKLFRGL
jgi:transcriptional regulator with XRE-family HTH domain